MGNTRDLFKKIRDTKGTLHAKRGTRTEMVWTQQKQKIRRGGKNTQKNCTKKDLHNPDNHNGVITRAHYLEPVRARYPRMSSQMGLRKHTYEQS